MATILDSPARISLRDPVCGMEIGESDAAAKRTLRDVAYYFCSDRCVTAFDAEPSRYTATASTTTGAPALEGAGLRVQLWRELGAWGVMGRADK